MHYIEMFAHVCGKSIKMDEVEKYRVIVGDESDFIITVEEVDQYELYDDVLIKKETISPTLHDASLFSLDIKSYVDRYPERHQYHNYLNQEHPVFRRTSFS
jgi:hypothetical protein